MNAKKSYLWTILCDLSSGKMNKYGEFNSSLSEEYDKDINSLN